MKSSIKTALFFFIIISTFTSCGRRPVAIKYYVIEPVSNNDSSHNPIALDATCEIGQIEVFTAFSSKRIAHRNESHEIAYYGYHQWAVLPQIEMTQLLQHQLQQQNIFRNVSTRFWKLTPNYLLKTTVYQLETIHVQNSLSAHLHLNFSLINAVTNEIVLSHTADRIEPLKKNNMNLFAAAISEIFSSEIQNLSMKIRQDLALQ